MDLAHSGCSTCGCWMKDHNSNGMQSSILFFLALEPLPFFQATQAGSQYLSSDGPEAVRNGRGDMRWGGRGERYGGGVQG